MRRVLQEYVAYFNTVRPHQGIGQRIPSLPKVVDLAPSDDSTVIALPMLGGLHHAYSAVT